MSYKNQIHSKVLSGTVISILGTVVYLFLALIFIKAPIVTIIVALLIDVLACFLFNYIQIFIDFLRPKLNWENEQAALKQNFNTFLEMLIVILLGVGIGIIGVLLYIKTGISIYVLGAGMVVFLFITTIVVAKLITLWGTKELYSLE
jgi:ABC-2 type transport system permease protein